MDHHAEQREHHEKEREHHKKEQAAHERAEEKSTLPFHPAWLAVVGVVLTLLVVLVWTFLI
jgi:hypothetical protein